MYTENLQWILCEWYWVPPCVLLIPFWECPPNASIVAEKSLLMGPFYWVACTTALTACVPKGPAGWEIATAHVWPPGLHTIGGHSERKSLEHRLSCSTYVIFVYTICTFKGFSDPVGGPSMSISFFSSSWTVDTLFGEACRSLIDARSLVGGISTQSIWCLLLLKGNRKSLGKWL